MKTAISPELRSALNESRELGFLGPGEIAPHVSNALAFVEVLEKKVNLGSSSKCLDLGSGGGVPGLVIAERIPELEVVLLDASEKRIAWLRDVQKRLLVSTDVELGRAEELGRREDLREEFDVVVARSFGHPAATLECASAFVRCGGSILVSETPHDRPWPAKELGTLGLEFGSIDRRGRYGTASFFKAEPLEDRYPRRNGVPVRKPLFELPD